jgi:predicted glycoside hydrolase/deacetylase ChbG (UPF0249 family)
VNADDFGLSDGVNSGIATAFEHGIVRSGSLMVRAPAAASAAAWSRGRPAFSLGLHLDLGEWVCEAGEWRLLYRVVDLDDATAVGIEVAEQIAHFERLTGTTPTHLDSHQHVHKQEPVRSVVLDWAQRFAIPLRHFGTTCYVGDFYGQSDEGQPYPEYVSVEALVALLDTIDAGTTELGCHPGDGRGLDTVYRDARAAEVVTLCHPLVRDAINQRGIELCSFRDVVRLGGSSTIIQEV